MNNEEKALREPGNEAFMIYGAGLMGQSLCRVLSGAPYYKDILCFVVRSKTGNPDYISGIKVLSIKEAIGYRHRHMLVALHEKQIKDAMSELKAAGFDSLIPITFDSDLWSDIREAWINENNLLPYSVSRSLKEMGKPKLHIYVVHSEFDKALNEDIQDMEYEIPIQAGAELADDACCGTTDNIGENISNKNGQYCELTALYWAWKNDSADYIGLSHYRRKFKLDGADIAAILSGNIDMAVTTPVINFNTVKGQYGKDHFESDWDIMAEAVEKLSPQYSEAVEKVGAGFFYYAYNMFIADRKTLDAYCSWLFPILFYCEQKIGRRNDAYENRYIGFLGERLLTIYIAKHPELRVALVKKHFIGDKAD